MSKKFQVCAFLPHCITGSLVTYVHSSRLLTKLVGSLILLSGSVVRCQTSPSDHEASLPAVAQNAEFMPFCMTQKQVSTHPGRDGLLITLTTEIRNCQNRQGRTRYEQSYVIDSTKLLSALMSSRIWGGVWS